MGLHGFALVCMTLHGFERVCMGFRGFVWLCVGLRRGEMQRSDIIMLVASTSSVLFVQRLCCAALHISRLTIFLAALDW